MLLIRTNDRPENAELGPVTGSLLGRHTVALVFGGGVLMLTKADCLAALDGVQRCAAHGLDPADE